MSLLLFRDLIYFQLLIYNWLVLPKCVESLCGIERFQVKIQVNYNLRNVVCPLNTQCSGRHNWLQMISTHFPSRKLVILIEFFHSPNWVSLLEWTLKFLKVLWSFIISLKYGLIISKYSSGDKFLSLSPLLWYSM